MERPIRLAGEHLTGKDFSSGRIAAWQGEESCQHLAIAPYRAFTPYFATAPCAAPAEREARHHTRFWEGRPRKRGPGDRRPSRYLATSETKGYHPRGWSQGNRAISVGWGAYSGVAFGGQGEIKSLVQGNLTWGFPGLALESGPQTTEGRSDGDGSRSPGARDSRLARVACL